MGSDVDVALCCGPQKKWRSRGRCSYAAEVPTVGQKRKVRGPHGGPEKESPPGRTDLVLPGIEVDLDVAQPLVRMQVCRPEPIPLVGTTTSSLPFSIKSGSHGSIHVRSAG
jgi:hypothetical protein